MMAGLYEYEALTDLDIDGVMAFRVGDDVPAEHVERLGWKDGVDVQAKTRTDPVPPPATVESVEAETPGKSASKADWVDYVASLGVPRDEAEQRTRDELVAEYGA